MTLLFYHTDSMPILILYWPNKWEINGALALGNQNTEVFHKNWVYGFNLKYRNFRNILNNFIVNVCHYNQDQFSIFRNRH